MQLYIPKKILAYLSLPDIKTKSQMNEERVQELDLKSDREEGSNFFTSLTSLEISIRNRSFSSKN
jgi:hypothetical protein